MRTAHRLAAAGIAAALALPTAGCYSTKLYAPSDVPRGETYTDRQWFLLYGAVPLDDSSGEQCTNGVAEAEFETGLVDLAISAGLTAVGIAGGLLLCDDIDDSLGELACAQAVALGTNIIGSRTVKYTCVAGPGGAVRNPFTQKPAAAEAPKAPEGERSVVVRP